MPKRSGRRRKTRTHVVEDTHAQSALSSNDAALKIPKSVIVRRGKVESEVTDLIHDLRKLMLPHTALKLNDSLTRKLKLSDYAKHLSAPMGVTHILAFSQKKDQLNLRIARTPTGPTLQFKVKQFTLMEHVRKIQRRPFDSSAAFQHCPVVVTNNFGDVEVNPHVKLMRITFQNMFPAINVATVKLADCRRVVLFNLLNRKDKDGVEKEDKNGENTNKGEEEDDNEEEEEEEEVVEVRHYAIRATPVGINRKVRKLVQLKLPNLQNLNDVSDYILGSANNSSKSSTNGNMSEGMISDSEAEDETSHVVLPQRYNGKGNVKSQKSALKLVELGPRLTLKLMKVERGLGGGDVMYHSYVKKTPEEARETKRRVEEKENLKKRRREEQEANVARKQRLKDEKKERKRLRKEERERQLMDELRNGGAVDNLQNYDDEDEESGNEEEPDSDERDENEQESESDDEE